MRVLSIDVGIKNMAMCLLDADEGKGLNILQWDVLNLCGEAPICNCFTQIKKKSKMCNKKATYEKDGVFYCKIHAKKTGYIIPPLDIKINNLNLKELIVLSNKYNISIAEPIRKKTVLCELDKHIKNNSFNVNTEPKANEMSLIDVGIAIAEVFTKRITLDKIDCVIIENQISPLANRMKTIQGMVAQYFIMKDIHNIHFISAMNKLKQFTRKKMTYKERKKYGIDITTEMLKKNSENVEWVSTFEKHKKQDDLADSFLQGLWFLYDNNLFKHDANSE
uniref:Mitochondrial resolvase Ydc2 catalytic domain-containing protein n=1 Tax=viral metagenome TaxID=1070528 RepID=A0A6C0BX83_9ZZZZ